MKPEEIKIDKKNQADFCKDLIEKIFSMPYGSISKPDLQEYLLYLIDKYGEKKVLSLPDTELELLLKASRSKVQNIRNNINLKYSVSYDFTDEKLLENLMNLPSKTFHFSENVVSLIIDNPLVRDHLEYVLREKVGQAFDYKNNRTIVEIKYDAFLKCLEELLKNMEKSDYNDLKKNLSSLKTEHIKDFALKAVNFTVDKTASLIGAISGIIGALK